jgi:hypothetical protein
METRHLQKTFLNHLFFSHPILDKENEKMQFDKIHVLDPLFRKSRQ